MTKPIPKFGPVELPAYLDAVEARAYWLAAKKWLVVWKAAGFELKVRHNKMHLSAEDADRFTKEFPDGPHLIDLLRKELIGLLTKGNGAVLDDKRLAALDGPTIEPEVA